MATKYMPTAIQEVIRLLLKRTLITIFMEILHMEI